MGLKRIKLVIAAAVGVSGFATSAALAQEASDPQGLGSAYNYQIPGTASATCCGRYYDHSHANGNAVIMMKNTNQKLAAMQLAIIEALRLGTGQLSGNMREQTGADHTLADQQDDRATVKAVEEARMKALVDATSGTTSCYVATGSGGGSLEGTVNQSAQAYSRELDKWIRGESAYSQDGQERAVLNRLVAYCGAYATEGDVASSLCKSVGSLPGASVNASESLFHRGTDGNSLTYSQERAEAANAFIMNTFAATPFTPQTDAESQSPEGRRQAAQYKTQQARDSVGREIAIEYAKAHEPQSAGGTLTSWAQARLDKMQGMSGVDASKLSYQQWLAIYGKGFLLDTESLVASDQNSVTAIKDMKNMMAVLTYLAYEQYEQQQKINVQLAVTNAILGEQTRTDGIFARQ